MDSSEPYVISQNVNRKCVNLGFEQRMGSHSVDLRMETMFWDETKYDSSWLDYSLVGVLKSFIDISSVIYSQKRPKVFKVNTRRQNFTVFIKEDHEPIKYKVILSWLGLDWFDSDGETSSSLGASDGGRCGGSDKRHVNEEALGRPDIINDKPQIQVNQSGLRQTIMLVWGMLKLRVRKGAAASRNEKAIMVKDFMKRRGCIGGTVDKLALDLVDENSDSWSSSFEDNGNRDVIISNKCREAFLNRGMGQKFGGNIIIDLGCVKA
ncbi:hypothetical protein QYF36_015016 [Acer negundo]|nr:hypothetical protein QYF36_015016 [Acer negundo]